MLGLKVRTDPGWTRRAVDDLSSVLRDHAHCEMKAAANALSLSARASHHPRVLYALVSIAEEEIVHMRRVLDALDARGLALGPPSEDAYAAELRKAVSSRCTDKSLDSVLVDRLVVGAIIEARSCERFKLLADALADRDADLAAFYEELFEAEARHYRTMIDLAVEVRGDEPAVRARLDAALELEAVVVRGLAGEPTMHG